MKIQTIKSTIMLLTLLGGTALFAQQAQPTTAAVTTTETAPLLPVVKLSDNVQVKFGGFVRTEAYYDSRETVGAIEDLFGFFPENKSLDLNGKDINNVARVNLSSQATRFNALFTGPDALGAKSTAFFEYDFTGGNDINLRLRHAYVKLNWSKSELLIGKTWSPLAETIFPSVIGLHTGIPFRPFGRGDQLRITWKPTSNISVLAAALYQSENKSFTYDAAGAISNVAANDIRSNPIPELHFQLHFKTNSLFAGLIGQYKVVRPNSNTTTSGSAGKFFSDETISSFSYGAFANYKSGKFEAKASGLLSQNIPELWQQGGYAVKSFDAATGAKTFTVSNSVTSWVNFTYGTKLVAGIFAGYQKNLGFNDNILTPANGGAFLGRWQNVDHIYRIAPSLKYTISRIVFAAELDFNTAGYGNIDYANKGKVIDSKNVSNVRALFATTFLF